MYIDKFIYTYICTYIYICKKEGREDALHHGHALPPRTPHPPPTRSFRWTVSAPDPPSTAGYTPIYFKMVHVNDSAAPKESI